MASAPSSPERPQNGDAPRRLSDQFTLEDRRVATDRDVDNKAGPVPEVAAGKKRSQSRGPMAGLMSGLESKLFPKSFSRGRDSSRGRTSRASSLDARSPSTGSQNVRSEQSRGKQAVKEPINLDPGERMAKDMFDRDNNLIESSEDDDEESSGDESPDPSRGRKKKYDITMISPSDFKKPKTHSPVSEEGEKQPHSPSSVVEGKKPRKSALKVTIRPQTSFDIPTPYTQSAAGTPYGSEDEAEKEDIHRAQRLSITVSAIDNSVPSRSIRTIIRGNFAGLQEEADGGRRRQRKYIIATDLSEESVYALEWTIGAVLRDGDTVYAIYCLQEDLNGSSVQVGEGGKAMQDAAAVVGTQTKEAAQISARNLLGRLGPGSARPGSASSRVASDARVLPAEAERVKAVETVSDTFVKLLRKTLLQVRVAVEVIQCKSPKFMITEAIDEIEPTLVIVGARGQSALKGVLLGSFSNYLLTNSSAPVMVARSKLKRNTSKGKTIRLTNNLRTPKSLTQAKVD
ncbi:hypothetical protein N7495_004038 [Penicillium taxi]|uniref:uncharacterized protein n=1 Tax=Penicillium taxi TaxID=168475 RepID=UPI002545BD72|nr:uncharacterized protein N7495_004038 [Penicillium taxi]KAJ5899294.1 hypothetical protein N7495_004038 [Penicillium taxi]